MFLAKVLTGMHNLRPMRSQNSMPSRQILWVAKLKALPDNTWLQANPEGISALASRNRAEVPMSHSQRIRRFPKS